MLLKVHVNKHVIKRSCEKKNAFNQFKEQITFFLPKLQEVIYRSRGVQGQKIQDFCVEPQLNDEVQLGSPIFC